MQRIGMGLHNDIELIEQTDWLYLSSVNEVVFSSWVRLLSIQNACQVPLNFLISRDFRQHPANQTKQMHTCNTIGSEMFFAWDAAQIVSIISWFPLPIKLPEKMKKVEHLF